MTGGERLLNEDLIKKKIVYSRTSITTYTSTPVEFPIGIGEVVSLIAIHWHIEQMKQAIGQGIFIAALSENPDHELNPPIGVAEFQGNLSLYGMATWIQFSAYAGTDYSWGVNSNSLIIPLYGILRPKRQVAVFANVWAGGYTGVRGEIYYIEERPGADIVNAISRRYGKYRRT